MADAGSVRAGSAFVELFFQANPSGAVKAIQDSLKNVGAALTDIGGGMIAAGSAIVAPLVGAAIHFSEVGDALQKMSLRTGVAASSLSALSHAASASGTSVADLETGLTKYSRVLTEAGEGSDKANKAFTDLGLSAGELAKLSREDQIGAIADKLKDIEDPAKRAAATMEIFGKSGTKLLPMLLEGSAGIKKLTDEARDLGIVMSDADAEGAAVLNDALGRLMSQLEAISLNIGAAIAPAMAELIDLAAPILRGVIDWIKANRDLIVTLGATAVAIAVVGAALVGVGAILGSGFAIPAAALAVAAMFVDWGAAAMGFQSVLASIQATVGPWVSAIGAAISAGDFAGAMDIVIAGWNLAWAEGLAALTLAWIDFKETYLGHIPELWTSIEAAWEFIKQVWGSAVQFIADAWSKFLGMFGSGFKVEAVTIADIVYETAKVMIGYWADLQGAWVNLTTNMLNAWTTMANGVQTVWASAQQGIANGIVNLWGMIDTTLDKAGALNELNAQYARDQKARDEAAASAIAGRNEGRDASLASIEARRKAQADAINAMQANAAQQGKKLFAEQRDDANAALAAARKAAEATLASAKEEARVRKEGSMSELLGKLGWKKSRDGKIETGIGASASTFSAAAAGQIFSGGTKQERLLEQEVKWSERIFNAINGGGGIGVI